MLHAAQKRLRQLEQSQPPPTGAALRALQIDSLATLGDVAVHVLADSENLLAGWNAEERQRLQRFAGWRTAGQRMIHARFPRYVPNLPPYALPTPQPIGHEVPPSLLAEIVEKHKGQLPVCLTAPHGGNRIMLGGQPLPRDPTSTKRDEATAEIARDIRMASVPARPLPSLLIDTLHRAHRTPQSRAYFETQALLHLCQRRKALPKHQPLLHLDIHGFSPTPATETYDLILGTGHRTTMGGLHADRQLADFMAGRGYVVYLPTAQPQADEYYTADFPGTLAQRVRTLALPHTGSIQIEINAAYRSQEGTARGQQLARDLGAFCVAWAS